MALNKWATAIISSWLIFGIMASFAVALRLWSRRIQKLHLMFNDYAIIMALVCLIKSHPEIRATIDNVN